MYLDTILESLIQKGDPGFWKKTYTKNKGKLFEKYAAQFLVDIMPGAKYHNNLQYPIIENGIEKWPEIDGLILYDDKLILIEYKTRRLSAPAVRGGIKRIKTEFENVVGEAFEQSYRAYKYISTSETPVFYDKKRNPVLDLGNYRYDDIIIITITYDPFYPLLFKMADFKNLGIIKGDLFPWAIPVNDLRIISELIEFPSEFFHYVTRRLNISKSQNVFVSDELDLFIYYLNRGNLFNPEDRSLADFYSLSSFTDCVDRYYFETFGCKVGGAEKPTFNIDPGIKQLINEIERTEKYGFTTAAELLLDLSVEGRLDFLEQMNATIGRAKSEGGMKDCNVNITNHTGISYYAWGPTAGRDKLLARRHGEVLKYIAKARKWLLLYNYDSNKPGLINDFDCLNFEWVPDPRLEEASEVLKRTRLNRLKISGIKIGRNDTCPCGSGKKYKKCCLGKYT